MTLHLVSAAARLCNPTPASRAADDLMRYAERLCSMAAVLRPNQVGAALRWGTDWRMYGFERNFKRWPDGRFYLLNRGYQHWRGHQIGFSPTALSALGCDEWDRRVIVLAHDQDFLPLETDCFHRSPRRHLGRYAALVKRIAEHFMEEERLRGGA